MSTNRRHFLALAGAAAAGVVAAPALLRGTAGIARAQAIPGAASVKGAAGKSIQGPVSLNAGMAVFRAQHNGTENFSMTLLLPNPAKTVQQSVDDGSYTDSSLVYNEIGAVKANAVAMIGTPGSYYMSMDASGAYQVSIEQPVPGNVRTVQQTSFSGRGKDVSPYFTLPAGLTSLSVQTNAMQLHGWLYHLDDLGGAPLPDGINVYDGRFFDFTFPGNQTSYPVLLPDAGPYLLAVDNIGPTETWTYSFQ